MAGTRRKTTSAVKTTSASKRAKTLDLGWKGDDEIDSDDDSLGRRDAESSGEEEEEETLEAKKVRLAREYLEKIEEGSSSSDSEEEDDEDEVDRVGLKLQRQRLKREGVYEREIADKLAQRLEAIKLDLVDQRRREQPPDKRSVSLKAREQAKEWVDNQHVTLLKGHDLTTTCISLQRDGSRAVSGSKDHSVILWDLERENRIVHLWDHWRKGDDNSKDRTAGQVLSVACSDDGRYVAVGRNDASVQIFDIRTSQKSNNLVKTFTGHKSAITCLTFQTQSLQLFSGSEDRCIRHYNLEEMMYLETLYGHQFGVTGMDCHRKERPISVGRDRTAGAWKLQEDTHLIFRGGAKLSAGDCVSVIKDDWFLTGHENGQLCLWMTEKKKAIATIDFCHGMRDSSAEIGNSVGSICALKGSDVACSGSSDGFLRFWKVQTGPTLEERGLEPLSQVPLVGFINDIDIGPKAKFCVAAVGQEPRLGRWNRVAKAKNRVAIVKLNPEETAGASEGDDEGEKDVAAGDDYGEPAGVQSYEDDED